MPVVQSPGSAKKGCICHVMQSLMKGKDFSKAQQTHTHTHTHRYIYIYIYMKADKGVAEIKICYPMFACEGKL